MNVKLSNIETSIMLNSIPSNLPMLINMDREVKCEIMGLQDYSKVELFTLQNKKMSLASYKPKNEDKIELIEKIGLFWNLKKFENEIVTSFDVEYLDFTSAPAIVYYLDTEKPFVKVLLCFTYKGDAGRSAMIGLVTKLAKVEADESFFSFFE